MLASCTGFDPPSYVYQLWQDAEAKQNGRNLQTFLDGQNEAHKTQKDKQQEGKQNDSIFETFSEKWEKEKDKNDD